MIDKATKHFRASARGRAQLPCGTGKSLIAYFIANAMQVPRVLGIERPPAVRAWHLWFFAQAEIALDAGKSPQDRSHRFRFVTPLLIERVERAFDVVELAEQIGASRSTRSGRRPPRPSPFATHPPPF